MIKNLLLCVFSAIFLIQPVNAEVDAEGHCTEDADCPGTYCQSDPEALTTFADKYCAIKKKENGETCEKNIQCQSGKCFFSGMKSLCALPCTNDADCPGTYCISLNPSNTYCAIKKLENDETCKEDKQCKSGQCLFLGADPNLGTKIYKCASPAPSAPIKNWAPIAPTLEIKIPTLQPFTTQGLEKIDAEGNIYFPFIGQYIVGIYKWMLLVAGIIATVMIILGGFTYLTSGGNATQAGQGKERIGAAIFGLILLLGSYMLLYLINPGLVEFRSLKIKIIEREEIEAGAETSDQVYYGQSADIGCFFSNFGQTVEDVKNNLVTVQFLNKNYQVHKKMAPALTAAATEIKGLNYNIKTGAAFPGYWRENVNNPKKLSLHSFGIALDINSEENPNYHRPSNEICNTSPCSNPCKTNIPKEIINALNKNGFRWGGNFKKVCDSMHFEWLGPCAKGQ